MKPSDWELASRHTDDLITRVILWRMMILQRDQADIELDDGAPYVVRGYDYWIKFTGGGREAVRAALNRLRERGMIETQNRRAFGQVRLHIRLATGCRKSASGDAENLDGTMQKSGTANNRAGSTASNRADKRHDGFAALRPPGVKQPVSEKEEVVLILNTPPSFDNARKVWSTYWYKHESGPPDGFPQTVKMRAMWKQAVKKMPTDRNPLQLIANAVGHWEEFRATVKLRTGKGMPTSPTLLMTLYNVTSLLEVSDVDGKPPPPKTSLGKTATDKMLAKIAAGDV